MGHTDTESCCNAVKYDEEDNVWRESSSGQIDSVEAPGEGQIIAFLREHEAFFWADDWGIEQLDSGWWKATRKTLATKQSA